MSRIFLKARRPPRRVDVSDVRRLVSTLGGNNFAATSAVSDSWVDNHLLEEKVEKYSVFHPTPISLEHFVNFGQQASAQSSFLFLKRELPVR